METNFRYLAAGIDTIEIAYYLSPTHGTGIDFENLAIEKERLRNSKTKKHTPVTIGGVEFMLGSGGTKSGFTFLLRHKDYDIQLGENNKPNFFVKYHSHALWHSSPLQLHQDFLSWASESGYTEAKPHRVSRADHAFDYHMPEVDFGIDNFVTRASKDSTHRNNGKAQTYSMGKGDILLRIYNKSAEIEEKSHKTWFYDIWNQAEDVWRIEWQVRKTVLRQFNIVTIQDLDKYRGDMLVYLSENSTTLKIPNGTVNKARWALHPLWINLQEQIAKLPQFGLCRYEAPNINLEENMARIAISVYGNLKHLSAMHTITTGKEVHRLCEILDMLKDRLLDIHDRASWDVSVTEKIKLIRAGILESK